MLKGLKVVEMATYIAAPAAGAILADWGATVIKIEPKGGDPIRQFYGVTAGATVDGHPMFDMDNRGKRSMMIDTGTPEGADLVRRLVADADVFLTNVRPQSLEKTKLDYASLKAAFPRLVYATVTGYGLEGADRDKSGLDLAAFWSRSGLASLTTPKGEDIVPMRVAVGDHTTAMATVSAILAAVIAQRETGKGRLVETSLLRTGIYCLGSDLANQLRFGRVASTKSRQESTNPLNSFYKTADGRWICLLARQTEKEWQRICAVLDRPDLFADERFKGVKGRKTHCAELTAEMDRTFAGLGFDAWAARLDAHDVIWAPVLTPAEVVNDPQAIASGAFSTIPDGKGGSHRTVAAPARFHETDLPPGRVAPGPGEHTDQVLAELGFSAGAIRELRAKGAVA